MLPTEVDVEIFADESGYSGTKLMNADAPVFIVATSSISNETAAHLIRDSFPDLKGELHFAEQRHEYRDQFLALLKRLLEFDDQIFVALAHKPFITLIKTIDHWIDTALELRGETLYKNRRNYALACVTYHAIFAECGQAAFFKYLRSFQDMMLGTDVQSYNKFWNSMRAVNCPEGSVSRRTVDNLVASESLLGGRTYRDSLRALPLDPMDIVLTMEQLAIHHWSKLAADDRITYVHDAASEFAGMAWLWDKITSHANESDEFKIGDRRYDFPLKVVETKFVDSKNHPAIQICDVIASSLAEITKKTFGLKYDETLVNQLLELDIVRFVKAGVWPSDDPKDWIEDPSSQSAEMLEHGSTRMGKAIDEKRPSLSLTEKEVIDCMNCLKRREYKEAFICLKKLEKMRKQAGLQLIIGYMHDVGLFVPQSTEQALEWFSKAISNADPDFDFLMALHIIEDQGCDPKRFISLIREKAEAGDPEAGYKLAGLYLHGLPGHLGKDQNEVFYWANKTAPTYLNSQRLLSACYFKGIGVKRNQELGAQWFIRFETGSAEYQ